jgi:hypothetical protein
MGEVIRVDFQRKAKVISNPFYQRFIEMLDKHGLDQNDILEVEDAIRDPKAYDSCEGDIKKIVDIWFEHTANL